MTNFSLLYLLKKGLEVSIDLALETPIYRVIKTFQKLLRFWVYDFNIWGR